MSREEMCFWSFLTLWARLDCMKRRIDHIRKTPSTKEEINKLSFDYNADCLNSHLRQLERDCLILSSPI